MADRPALLVAADPPRRSDPPEVAKAKALAVAEAYADLHGLPFGALLVPPQQDQDQEAS